jgi:hypothetical protein
MKRFFAKYSETTHQRFYPLALDNNLVLYHIIRLGALCW